MGDGEEGVRRFASKNPKLFKIRQKQERERKKKMGDSFSSAFGPGDESLDIKGEKSSLMGQLLVKAKRKMFIQDDSGSDEGRNAGRTPTTLIINEEGLASITNPQHKVTVSPERRRTVHMAMHNIVQARMHGKAHNAQRSSSLELPVARSIT